ncbi:MAG: CBS domain-containing protein [Nitrospirota bacterium]
MILNDILEAKPIKIISIRKDSTVAEAIKIMEGADIGCILIVDEHNKLIGIFTERDVMHCIVKNISLDKEIIKNVMTANPLTLDASTDVSTAITSMSRKRVRHLPVMKGNEIAGVISYRDLVAYLLPEIVYMAEDIY